jgi:outer membrane usher protein
MRCLRLNLAILISGALFWGSALADAEDLQFLLAETVVNYQDHGQTFLLRDDSGALFVHESDLEAWRVRRPFPEPVTHDEQIYHPLNAINGASFVYDDKTVSVDITLPPSVLEPMFANASGGRSGPKATTGTGGYLDYDLSYIDTTDSYLAGYVAPSIFSPAGVLHSDFAYRSNGSASGETESGEDWVRLDSNFTRDDPANMRSYRAGDVISAPGPWGGAYRMGGAQIASNFSTQPYSITFPTPSIAGSAATPSTVDLYVNGMLRQTENFEPGEFRMDNVPVVTGAGQVRMVVTDVLGREQVVYQDFYASSRLLRSGLVEYSYSLGALRKNYGYESNDYDDMAFVGSHRYGFSDQLTLGTRLDATADNQLLAGTSDWLLDSGGVLRTGLGVSSGDPGLGTAWLLGYEWNTVGYNLGAQATGTSNKFSTLDSEVTDSLPELQLSINGGWSRGIPGSIQATLVHQSSRRSGDRSIATLGYNRSFRGGYFVSAYTSLIHAEETDTVIGLSMSKSFGNRRSAAASASFDENETSMRMETRYDLPAGPGVGYRVGTTLADENGYDAHLSGQTDFGLYTLDVQKYGNETPWILGTTGSMAWLGGRGYLSRDIMDGFAVADIGDFENVRVYVENQEIGRSDSNGKVLLPSLRPYESNRIRIEPNDLPLGAQVATTSVEVAPYYRSGMVIDFEAKRVQPVLLHAYQADGTPIPEGAVVRMDDQGEPLPVGRDGLIFVPDLTPESRLVIRWNGISCELQVPMPDGDHPMPDLGRFSCGEPQ